MKLSLSVFSNLNDSKNCTLKALIAFAILIFINIIYIYLISGTTKLILKKNNKIKSIVAYLIALVLVASAIAVNNPNEPDNKDTTESRAIAYGALVGLVVYSFANVLMFVFIPKWTFFLSLSNTSFGIISIAITSLFTYYIADKANLYN